MNAQTSTSDTAVVLTFSGELDAGDTDWSDELAALIDGGTRYLVVDLLNVTFVDSSVVRSLIVAHRRVTAADGWIRVVFTHHLIRRVIEICGLSDVLPQFSTIDAALRGAPARQYLLVDRSGARRIDAPAPGHTGREDRNTDHEPPPGDSEDDEGEQR